MVDGGSGGVAAEGGCGTRRTRQQNLKQYFFLSLLLTADDRKQRSTGDILMISDANTNELSRPLGHLEACVRVAYC